MQKPLPKLLNVLLMKLIELQKKKLLLPSVPPMKQQDKLPKPEML